MERLDADSLALARHMAAGGATSRLIAETLNVSEYQVDVVTGRCLPDDLPVMSEGSHPSREILVDFSDPRLQVVVVDDTRWPPLCDLAWCEDEGYD